MLKIISMMLAGASALLAFHVAELNINDKDFEASLRFDMGQFNEAVMPDSTFFGFRYIQGSEEHSDMHKTEGLVDASFLLQRPFGPNNALSIGMGVKYVYTRISDEDFSAIPLGLQARYLLPLHVGVPVYAAGEFYYSPEVLSFSDAKNYIEYRALMGVEMIERGHIIAGYRNIDTNFDIADVNYNSSWFLGFRFQF